MTRKSLRKIFTIARHEFTVTVMRASYLIVTLGLPLFIGGSMMLSAGIAMKNFARGGDVVAAIVDRAGIVKIELAKRERQTSVPADDGPEMLMKKRVKFVHFDDLNSAIVELKQRRAMVCYIIEPDYLKTGKVTSIVNESETSVDAAPTSERELAALLRASLLADHVAEEIRERATNPAQFQRREYTVEGEIKPESNRMQKILKTTAPMLLCLMLWMSIFISANYLLQSVSQEKQNRVIEVMLSSVRTIELLSGKLIGLGAAGLIQSSVYAVLLGLPVLTQFSNSGWKLLVLSLFYAALGYLLFAVLMAATGILGNNVQESAQLAMFWTFWSLLPAIILGLSGDMSSWLARAMSYFPLTGAVTMLIRVSYARVAFWEILLSSATLIAGIWLAIRYSAKVFRVASLLYGKRPTVPEIWRWMREA